MELPYCQVVSRHNQGPLSTRLDKWGGHIAKVLGLPEVDAHYLTTCIRIESDNAADALDGPRTKGGGKTAEDGEVAYGADSTFEWIAAMMLDDNAVKITAIAQDGAKSADERMKEIIRIDPRFKGRDSGNWGSLLGVTPPAIRQTECWTILQREAKAVD